MNQVLSHYDFLKDGYFSDIDNLNMSRYNQYTSTQLFEQAKKSKGAERNYLLRLLLKKGDSKTYIKKLLDDEDIKMDTIRLLSPSDASRFSSILAKLLETGEMSVKKSIVGKIGNAADPILVTALIRKVLDRKEDNLLSRMAITALGNSGDHSVVAPLIQIFDKSDKDSKVEILLALG